MVDRNVKNLVLLEQFLFRGPLFYREAFLQGVLADCSSHAKCSATSLGVDRGVLRTLKNDDIYRDISQTLSFANWICSLQPCWANIKQEQPGPSIYQVLLMVMSGFLWHNLACVKCDLVSGSPTPQRDSRCTRHRRVLG